MKLCMSYILIKLMPILQPASRLLLLCCYVNKTWRICGAERKAFDTANIVFIWNDVTVVPAKVERSIVITCQWWNNHEFVLAISPSFFLSIRSCRSIGNYKVAARRFLSFPVEMWRIASMKIRFEVFTDKLSCKSEERDNKVIVLFRENSSIRLPLFYFLFYFSLRTKRIDTDKIRNPFNVSILKFQSRYIEYN